MSPLAAAKNQFIKKRDKLFKDNLKQRDSLRFSLQFSLLIEEFIRTVAAGEKYNFTLVSAGSFSRRELSPYSDIDLMFITENFDEDKQEISLLVTRFWDAGIEVSHTVRDYSDLSRFLAEDLHTFTQFFETRYLLGSDNIYKEWNKRLFDSLTPPIQNALFNDLCIDIQTRYGKYGDSPKVLEPNIKMSAGGLRDLQVIEWIYILMKKVLLNKQNEETQVELFIQILQESNYTTSNECGRLLESYRLLMAVRNLLHLSHHQKNDRFEFNAQQKISQMYYNHKNHLSYFMKDYFRAANVIHRFSKSMIKRFQEEITNPLPDSLGIDIDDDFIIKGKTISINRERLLSLSEILRAFYYRGLYSAHFDEDLRSLIVESIDISGPHRYGEVDSSVFFREIIKLPRNVGQTLAVMNELGVLSAFLPEYDDLNGFMQHGVYHCYTADEHTLITIRNVEKLDKDKSTLGKIYNSLKSKEYLFLGLLFHDIAKPINISGHEIIGAEMASSTMNRLGYTEEEIEIVTFLVKNHLIMEQVAFRRNLNDPDTLNTFVARFKNVEQLDLLYLVTYADLSAVNPAVWTSWKSDLLSELYRKARVMIEEKISGEELLLAKVDIQPKDVSRHSRLISENHVKEHIESINDITYTFQFSDQEIAQHVEEIQKGEKISVLFNESNDFTNITVITTDFPSLLSKLCGVLSINDANIHDARIFTRKDGIVIDSFTVTDFRSHGKIEKGSYQKIKDDFNKVVRGILQLNQEFANLKSRWWRIETKFFKRTGKVKVLFEQHERYTIIDITSPDRIGFLYQVTTKMNELGLVIYFARISTKGDDIIDSFYVLDLRGKKVPVNEYEMIKSELTETINQML
jgi:[protein-PII] uridylyltransferase